MPTTKIPADGQGPWQYANPDKHFVIGQIMLEPWTLLGVTAGNVKQACY